MAGRSSRRKTHAPRQGRGGRGWRLLAGGLVLAVAGAFFLARPLFADTAAAGPNDPSAATTYAAPVRGDANAPVTIVEYGDFQCPSCGAFARSTEAELIRRYVDTGKAKLVWKNFAWIGNESRVAAQGAACAGDQRKFWEYHDYLYAHQRGENTGYLTSANLKSFASALGLERGAFDACLDSGRYRSVVDRDGSEVRGLGLTGTPTFIINGTRVVGAQPIGVLASVIDQKLGTR